MTQEREMVQKIIKKYRTSSPYDLADMMNIIIHRNELGNINGYYYKAYRSKHIVLNQNLPFGEPEEKYVLSHELGHSILHPNANTPFLRANTYLSVERLEIEANRFAMELLITDGDIQEYIIERNYTVDMLSRMWGYQKELIELRLK